MDNSNNFDILRRQTNLIFAAVVISSFTLTAYLGLQARRSAADLALLQNRDAEVNKAAEQDYANNQAIFAKLTEFARTHPDFQKIFAKYRLGTNAPSAPPPKK